MNIQKITKGSAGDKPMNVPDFIPNKSFFMSIVGMRGSGKSLFTSNLLKQFYMKEIDHLVIFCPTQHLNHDYDWLKKEFPDKRDKMDFFTDVREFKEIVREIMKSQEDMITDNFIGRERTPRVMIIFDDCASEKGIFGQHGIVEKLALFGRHLKICAIVLSQVLSAISRRIRLNSEMIIMFRTINMSELQQFLEQYVVRSYRKTMESEMIRIFDVPHSFIAINNDKSVVTEGPEFKLIDLKLKPQTGSL